MHGQGGSGQTSSTWQHAKQARSPLAMALLDPATNPCSAGMPSRRRTSMAAKSALPTPTMSRERGRLEADTTACSVLAMSMMQLRGGGGGWQGVVRLMINGASSADANMPRLASCGIHSCRLLHVNPRSPTGPAHPSVRMSSTQYMGVAVG